VSHTPSTTSLSRNAAATAGFNLTKPSRKYSFRDLAGSPINHRLSG
jgi:hypothetical protein